MKVYIDIFAFLYINIYIFIKMCVCEKINRFIIQENMNIHKYCVKICA